MTRLKKTITLFSTLLYRTLFFSLFLIFIQKPAFAQCLNDSTKTEELKVLSWNIYMLPHFWIHTGQLERAKNIVNSLKNEDVDIIVFQEAFDNTSRKIIWDGLKDKFPFQSGNPTKNVSWKTSNGIWIISKTPLHLVKTIYFNESEGMDRFACKGAILIEAEKNNVCYQLIGTHLQSDLNHDVSKTRSSQYHQIKTELLEPFKKKNVPQIVVGDFNTIKDDMVNFQLMLNTMNVNDLPMHGELCYSYDNSTNDIIMDQKCSPQLIDYILFCNDGERKITGQTSVKVFRNKWDENHSDLSDHFAIAAVIKIL